MDQLQKELLWNQKQAEWTKKVNAKEAAWAASHPGIALQNGILKTGGVGTWLDPNGDPAENAAFADAWGRMGQNRERQAVNAATSEFTNDPYAAAFARTKARIASGSDMANAYSQFKLGQAQRRQQALSAMLGQQTGIDWQNVWNQQALDQQKKDRNAALWGTVGGLGGKALGAFG